MVHYPNLLSFSLNTLGSFYSIKTNYYVGTNKNGTNKLAFIIWNNESFGDNYLISKPSNLVQNYL